MSRIHLYSDGGCRGNPGPGAIGVVICTTDNQLLREYSECIGQCTNNQAEYRALIKGLDLCAEYTTGDVVCFSDSQLLINQMNRVWRLRDPVLRNLSHDVRRNAQIFNKVIYQYVRRGNQRISRADALVSQAHEGRCINKSYPQQ